MPANLTSGGNRAETLADRFDQAAHDEMLRQQFAAIVESSDDAIVSKTLDGIVTSWNRGAERIFGYTAQEMIGQPISRIACKGAENELVQILERIRRGERVDHYETNRRRKDGREIRISLCISPIRNTSGEIIGASKIARDITTQKQTELALLKAEKLAVIGRMAVSIAHEINNPLEAVTNILFLLSYEDLSEQARQRLDMAQHELSRAAHITTQTLGFYRGGAGPAYADGAEILNAALALHQGRILTSGIELKKDYAEAPSIRCNPGELRQVLANLVDNALDSMPPSGGRLRVKLRAATDWPTGRRGIRITVADTGHGMTSETRRRLFEPFYTTKEVAGVGLGLWVSSEIVAKHDGRFSVRSRHAAQHGGTVFVLFLAPGSEPQQRRGHEVVEP